MFKKTKKWQDFQQAKIKATWLELDLTFVCHHKNAIALQERAKLIQKAIFSHSKWVLYPHKNDKHQDPCQMDR
jgi:hypothetical protein